MENNLRFRVNDESHVKKREGHRSGKKRKGRKTSTALVSGSKKLAADLRGKKSSCGHPSWSKTERERKGREAKFVLMGA